MPVAVGLGINGVATIAFLGLANRVLGEDRYAAVGVLWTLMFAVGNGVMQPLEQEVARAVSERRAKGLGPGPVVRLAARIAAVFTLGLVVLAVLLRGKLLEWLDDDEALLVAFVIGLVGFAAGHLVRGTLSSHGRFRGYATFFGVDGLTRIVFAIVLAVVGVEVAGVFGMVLALTPFLAAGVAISGERDLLEDGPEASVSELSRALGWLLCGTASLSLLIQGGTIAVEQLSTEAQEEAAGVFLNGLQTARLPLFLFQAVLASLLPKLSHLAGQGRFDEFLHALRRLVGAIAVVGVVATLVAVVAGPAVVEVLFGSETVLGARDLGLLSAAAIVVMVAICFDQALIALGGHQWMALGWLTALGVFVGVTALGEDLFLRVELGFLAGAVWACAWMRFHLGRRMRHHSATEQPEVDLAEALAEVPIEP